jgi:hypothetical protein
MFDLNLPVDPVSRTVELQPQSKISLAVPVRKQRGQRNAH